MGLIYHVPPNRIPGIGWLCVMIFKQNQGEFEERQVRTVLLFSKNTLGRVRGQGWTPEAIQSTCLAINNKDQLDLL